MNCILYLILVSSYTYAQQSRIDELMIKDKRVSVYIPPGLKQDRNYPVLIFTDGQTCFGNGLNSLSLEKIADSLYRHQLIQPFFIVAVHSDENRLSDYIPYMDSGIFADHGSYTPMAETYVGFIRDDLLPELKTKYPVSDKTGIAGFSFGGLFAGWAALHYPELFSFSAAFSPSMWVSDFEIFKDAESAKANQVYYFDIGTGEWNYYLPFIQHSSLEPGRNIFYYEVKDALHTIYHVRSRVHNALLLFAGKNDASKSRWNIETEVIESVVQPGRFYLRLNPVIEYTNGLKYSLIYMAEFSVENEEIGMVNADGSFHFKKPRQLNVTVSYNGKDKKIKISYKEIENIKNKN